jgi:AraC-like DNA-binding protein
MPLAGPDLARVIYQSSHVTVCDVGFQPPYGPREYPLRSGSAVFIRSGIFAARIAKREFIVDANHVVFGGDGDLLVAMNASRTACTCSAVIYSGAAETSLRYAALCAPSAYLMHARLVNAVRVARADSAIDGMASQLTSYATTHSPGEPLGNAEHTRTVCAIKELINESLSKPVSLFDLGTRFYVSPFTISRWFHAETGLALRLYMQRLRLRRALTYILDEKRSLTAIAMELGFYDEPHFSKAFHAEFGVAPAMALTTSGDTRPYPPSVASSTPS